ncbi:hypothetical protein [Rubrivirga sp. IMCC43871]|uniref:hypothetical protein n=1 Tax=Rubrivirga sp. IMCC43871 TaxID=3391575 RepID=UPI0039900DC7
MLLSLVLAFAVTAMAMLFSGVVAGAVGAGRQAMAGRRRREARADELALLAAAVRRWRVTPAEWGGAGDGFQGVSFDAVGVATCPARGGRHTPHGRYRIVRVPPCADLDAALVRIGHAPGADGVLVVGWDPVTGEDAATIVLGPLVQVPLARVPWAWIAQLGWPQAATPVLPESPLPTAQTRPSRQRAVAPDRPSAPSAVSLRLVHWPERPPGAGVTESERAPPHVPWRRAA